MNQELQKILEEICEIESFNSSQGMIWYSSGAIHHLPSKVCSYGFNLRTAFNHKHYYITSQEPLEAAKRVLARLQEEK
jgi:hypothetical protein